MKKCNRVDWDGPGQIETTRIETNFGGRRVTYTMKGKRLTVKDMIMVVLEYFEIDIKVVDLCRKYNVNPSAFSK